MANRVIHSRVAGVTFENRQSVLEIMTTDMPLQIRPEPTNKFDPNALAVWVAIAPGDVRQCGYLPRDLAKLIAPLLDGEAVIARVEAITGGFIMWDDQRANLGLDITVEVPEDNHGLV
jgi:single-stranded-DNA-specific exonuclease